MDKPYERELKRSSELLRNLQRLKVSLKIGQVTLGDLPVQLGFADAKEWLAIHDSCRTAPKSATLHNFLQKPCECGLMHWKVRELEGARVTHGVGCEEWAAVLIHMMKEQVMQRFFRGCVVLDVCGHIVTVLPEPGKKTPKYSLMELDDQCIDGRLVDSIRHHICWVFPEDGISDRIASFVDAGQFMPSAVDRERALRAQTLATGKFQLTLKWEGVGHKVLRFHGALPAGHARVLVGEYVGVEHYCIQLMQKRRGKQMTPAGHGLFGNLSRDSSLEDNSVNPFRLVTMEAVNMVLDKQGLECSTDQAELVAGLKDSTGGCQGLEAVAGSGKTTIITAEVVAAIQYFNPEERGVWVGKARKMRTTQLGVFRKFIANPLHVIAMGRRVDGAAQQGDVEDMFFDDEVMRFLEERVGADKNELVSLQEQLNSMPAGLTPTHEDWNMWKRKAQRMHLLSTRVYAAKMQALEDLFGNVKIFLFTVDAFIQIASGESVFSKMFECIVWKLCVVDEAHQLTLYQVAAVAFAVQHVLLLFDRAQEIEFQKQNNTRSKEVILQFGDFYSWERAIFGGSQVAPWICLRAKDIHRLRFSWRFGPEVTIFQRYTSKLYGHNTDGIWSPQEKPELFSDKDLARVPNTRLRFVSYVGAEYDSCYQRGYLENQPFKFDVRIKADAKLEDIPAESVPRVASSQIMFCNMIHEGLVFLMLLMNGLIRLNGNTDTEPLCFQEGEQIIASIFYSNDVLIIFGALLLAALTNPMTLHRYRLSEKYNYLDSWLCATPEAVSGDTVLLCQTGIVPNERSSPKLKGNPTDPGRRVVIGTRARILCSNHLTSECFTQNVPTAWQQQHLHLVGKDTGSGCSSIQQSVRVDKSQRFASLSVFAPIPFDEGQAFEKLEEFFADIPKLVEEVRVSNPKHFHKFACQGDAEMMSRMLAVTDGLIEDIYHEDEFQDPDIEEASQAEEEPAKDTVADEEPEMEIPCAQNDEDAELLQEKCSVLRMWTVDAYRQRMNQQKQCIRFLPNVLATASYVFNEHSAQIVFLILNRVPKSEEDEQVAEMINLGRLLNVLLTIQYAEQLGGEDELKFVVIPHKFRCLAGIDVVVGY